MQVDEKLLSHLEVLTNLKLSDGEKSLFIDDLQKILNFIEPIHKFNTDGVPECTSPIDIANVFRDDEALDSFDRELILKNAPAKNDEMFIAPRTVE